VAVSDLDRFQLEIRVTNLRAATVAPGLEASELRVNGKPYPDWPFVISQGPRDGRWQSLPAGDHLEFGYALQDRLFRKPGTYVLELQAGSSASPPLAIDVVR
jgi:hypothetical protein